MLPWWLGLVAMMCARIRPPISARSPTMSRRLVAHELVRPAQRAAHHDPSVRQHERAPSRALDQPPGPQRLGLAREAEGAGRRQLPRERRPA